MKLPKLRTLLLAPLILFAVFYLTGVVFLLSDDRSVAPLSETPESHAKIVIFGASGTAGDGILKAAMADPQVHEIRVITRRKTARIDAGAASGKVKR